MYSYKTVFIGCNVIRNKYFNIVYHSNFKAEFCIWMVKVRRNVTMLHVAPYRRSSDTHDNESVLAGDGSKW